VRVWDSQASNTLKLLVPLKTHYHFNIIIVLTNKHTQTKQKTGGGNCGDGIWIGVGCIGPQVTS